MNVRIIKMNKMLLKYLVSQVLKVTLQLPRCDNQVIGASDWDACTKL